MPCPSEIRRRRWIRSLYGGRLGAEESAKESHKGGCVLFFCNSYGFYFRKKNGLKDGISSPTKVFLVFMA